MTLTRIPMTDKIDKVEVLFFSIENNSLKIAEIDVPESKRTELDSLIIFIWISGQCTCTVKSSNFNWGELHERLLRTQNKQKGSVRVLFASQNMYLMHMFCYQNSLRRRVWWQTIVSMICSTTMLIVASCHFIISFDLMGKINSYVFVSGRKIK